MLVLVRAITSLQMHYSVLIAVLNTRSAMQNSERYNWRHAGVGVLVLGDGWWGAEEMGEMGVIYLIVSKFFIYCWLKYFL